MGILNLLKADYTGKVGQTVGAKWKDKSTIRTYTKPSNPDTAAQKQTRKGFGEMSTFLSLFTEQIKGYSSLNTKGMSIRNAIMKTNKDMIADGELTPSTILINKGGLPVPSTIVATYSSIDDNVAITFDLPPSPVFSDKTIVVAVVADKDLEFAAVATADASLETITVPFAMANAKDGFAYLYFIDYRGSTRVGSKSVAKIIV